jgi:hypothetical protein
MPNRKFNAALSRGQPILLMSDRGGGGRAGFSHVRDVNAETHNHPFGDIYAEREGQPYLIGVKTRNMKQKGRRL